MWTKGLGSPSAGFSPFPPADQSPLAQYRSQPWDPHSSVVPSPSDELNRPQTQIRSPGLTQPSITPTHIRFIAPSNIPLQITPVTQLSSSLPNCKHTHTHCNPPAFRPVPHPAQSPPGGIYLELLLQLSCLPLQGPALLEGGKRDQYGWVNTHWKAEGV